MRSADFAVGDRQPLFVIAEIGLNHGGSLDRALALVDAAAAAGASAVKLQTFKADELVAVDCPAPAHVPAGSLREFFSSSSSIEPLTSIADSRETTASRSWRRRFRRAAVDMLVDDRRRRAQDRQRRPDLRRADCARGRTG